MVQSSISTEGCGISQEQYILHLGSTDISEENEQDFKSCKCQFWSLMQTNDDKPVP